ncbi:MAG: hypothetical protein JXB10_19480 [Pirellulales bacterium]|nr:hypothetical protein [Pirellulales bacterium]
MSKLEQAIFTSAVTDRAAGYQVVARSPGVRDADARELSTWCPSHDALLESGPNAVSFNFHPLPSGAWCVSRTVPAGWEYSGRGGVRVYTHCLLVPTEVLARFANNPFAVLKAATAGGLLDVIDPLPERLPTVSLMGGAAPVDQSLLLQLAGHPGPQAMAVFLQTAFDAACLAVIGEPSPERLIAGLMSCLPPACRCEFSFSTGLKFSPRRPFRLITVPDDPPQQRWLAHQHNVSVLDLSGRTPLPALPLDGWAQFIQRALSTGHTAMLAAQLSKRRFNLSPTDLSALGLQLLEDLEASAFSESRDESPDESSSRVPSPERLAAPGEEATEERDIQHAHAAHRRFEKTVAGSSRVDPPAAGESAVSPRSERTAAAPPSTLLEADTPEVQEKLERLDDLVFDAIQGQTAALDQLQAYWPAVKTELGDALLAESREQYLRYALMVWEECIAQDGARNPDRAIHALDVLCLLFDEC